MIGLFVGAQSRVGVAYYDIGALYDTIPSLFYRDDYTPQGPMKWDTKRYRESVERYAALLDTMAMNIVGLYGVENEQVALDVVAASRGDYALIHRTSNRLDGLDFALLYHADKLFPRRVRDGAGWFAVEGELDGVNVAILLMRRCRFADDLIEEYLFKDSLLIVLGDVAPLEGFGLVYAHLRAEGQGRANRFSKGYWRRGDGAWLDKRIDFTGADIFIARELLDEVTFRPKPLYYREQYLGGYSWRLPIYFYLMVPNLEN